MQQTTNPKNHKTMYQLTPEECQEMFQADEQMMANTYPTPNQGYCATVRSITGEIFTGASYNSDTWTLTMHGEMVALAHANSHGHKNIVAITGPNCHICKQLIYESSLNSGIDIVVLIKENQNILQVPISDLMPYPWPENKQEK
jgi:cytidine deaminase